MMPKKPPACTSALLSVSFTLSGLLDQGTERFFDFLGIAAVICSIGFVLLAVAKILKQVRKTRGLGARTGGAQEPDTPTTALSDRAAGRHPDTASDPNASLAGADSAEGKPQ